MSADEPREGQGAEPAPAAGTSQTAAARETERTIAASHETLFGPYTARGPSRGKVERRDALDFVIDDETIDRLTGRDRTRLRRLTAVKGVRLDGLDPVVLRALEDVKHDKRFAGKGEAARKRLSGQYLDDAEAVTERLNRQALPRTTRLILAAGDVYPVLLVDAIREMIKDGWGSDRPGNGGVKPDGDGHEHEHGGHSHG